MNLIDTSGFKEYMKKHESAFRAENEIIEEKLSQGINGLEWLVLQAKPDKETLEKSLDALKRICRIGSRDFTDVMKDAFRMNHQAFYDKHEINWWIVVSDGIEYLSILKERKYDEYFEFLQSIYKDK